MGVESRVLEGGVLAADGAGEIAGLGVGSGKSMEGLGVLPLGQLAGTLAVLDRLLAVAQAAVGAGGIEVGEAAVGV
jgi:hypothetical protein